MRIQMQFKNNKEYQTISAGSQRPRATRRQNSKLSLALLRSNDDDQMNWLNHSGETE